MSILKQSLVLLIVVIYLGIGISYLFFLPKYNQLRPLTNYSHAKSGIVLHAAGHGRHTDGSILVLLHRAYKTAVENKRDGLNTSAPLSVIILTIFAGGVIVLGTLRTASERNRYFRYGAQYAYLNYRSLRI